jgi:hypothetical protein
MVLLFVRGRAERHNRGRLAESTVETGSNVSLALPGLTFREAVRTRQFWQIILGLGPVGMVLIALQVNLVPMMTDEGLTPPQAALLLTVLGLSSLAGRLLGGFLIDRIHVRIIAPIIILAPIVGILLLHAPFVQAAAAVAFIGFTFGIESDLLPLTVTRYLGMQSFGKILGVLQSVFMITSALGPLLMGAAFDAAGSYAGVMPLLIGILVVCAIIIFFLGKYKYPPMTGFDKLAATDEIAAAEVLSNLAAGEALSRPPPSTAPEATRPVAPVPTGATGRHVCPSERTNHARSRHRLHRPFAHRPRRQGIAERHPRRRPVRADGARRPGEGARARPRRPHRPPARLRSARWRAGGEHGPPGVGAARLRPPARHDDHPVLRVVAADHPHGLPRDPRR